MPAAKTAFVKIAVQCSADPDASGWIIIHRSPLRISPPLEDIKNHCIQVAIK